MKMHRVLFVIFLTFLSGCNEEESPDAFYERYNQHVIEGISTFTEDAAYYSTKKRIEVESKMEQKIKQSGRAKEEIIKMYLEFSRAVAKCKSIVLVEKKLEVDRAILVYSQKDTCGNVSSSDETQTVTLVKENGWKIDDIEISL